MSQINQKEYLKKYLSLGKDGKKKKKRKIKKANGLKIIDYDDETITSIVQEDLQGDNEDAPQIVAVIDDRPPSLRIDDKSSTKLWIPIGGDDSVKIESESAISISKDKLPKRIKKERDDAEKIIVKTEPKSPDASPVRRNRRDSIGDLSPIRNLGNVVVKQEIDSEGDMSPPRKQSKRDKDRDMSPVTRKSRDVSPPRRHASIRQDEDGDISPDRKRDRDKSPPRRQTKFRQGRDGDISPVRRNNRNRTPRRDTPPLRRSKHDRDISPPRKNSSKRDKDKSPPRKRKDDAASPISDVKGKSEIDKIITDNPDTPQIERISLRDMVKPKKKKEVPKIDEETKKKYTRWGAGLKQVEDIETKIADDLHEMSKPLARYANDEDLDKYLREQEREGDPMLAYLRKKRKKKDVEEGKPSKPTYLGEFMPNRFGIRPGHRWDGVDRSNGYEKRWFEVQNSKMAQVEESYKWSTEDM